MVSSSPVYLLLLEQITLLTLTINFHSPFHFSYRLPSMAKRSTHHCPLKRKGNCRRKSRGRCSEHRDYCEKHKTSHIKKEFLRINQRYGCPSCVSRFCAIIPP